MYIYALTDRSNSANRYVSVRERSPVKLKYHGPKSLSLAMRHRMPPKAL